MLHSASRLPKRLGREDLTHGRIESNQIESCVRGPISPLSSHNLPTCGSLKTSGVLYRRPGHVQSRCRASAEGHHDAAGSDCNDL